MMLAETSFSLIGKVLARTVYGNSGEVLLTAGTPLSVSYIDRLQTLGVGRVYVVDARFEDVEVYDAVSPETRVQALKVMSELAHRAQSGDILESSGRGYGFIAKVVDSIILDVFANPLTIAACADLRTYDDYTFRHSVNTCIISLQLGRKAGLRGDKMRVLGVGALLHDVGKVYIPEEILNKPGRLHPHEFETVKNHSRLGWLALKGLSNVSPVARCASLQHHERHDGSGYPKGLTGNEICWVARFVAVADVFDALTSDRPYRKALANHEVLAGHLEIGNPSYDPAVLKLLHRTVCTHPPGSVVDLSDGREAVVLRVSAKQPNRPVVRILSPSCLDVDLSETPDIKIVDSADTLPARAAGGRSL